MSDNIEKLACEAALDRLDDYAAGRLDREGAALLEAHLSSCGRCAREYAELLKLTEAIKAAAAEPPASLRSSVMAGIAEQRRESKRLARIRYITRWSAVAAGAVIVLAVAATGIIGRMTKTSADMSGSDAAEKSATAAETYVAAASARSADDDIYASAAETAATDEHTAEEMEETPLMMMAAPSDGVVTACEDTAADTAGDSASYGGGETGAAGSSDALSGDVTAASGEMNMLTGPGIADTGIVKSSLQGIEKCSAPQWITASPSDDETEGSDSDPETKSDEAARDYTPDGSGYTYTAGTPYMSDPYDMPFTAAVTDPCTSADLVGDDALNEWGNTVYVTLDVRDRTKLPLLALVVRDFGVGVKEGAPTRDDLRGVLMNAGLAEADAAALADVLIDGDDEEIRRACIGEHATLADGDILTERWLEAHPENS